MKFKPPLALDERSVEQHFLRDKTGAVVADETLSTLKLALTSARVTAERFSIAHEKLLADETQPMAARLVKSKQVVEQGANSAVRLLDEARGKALAAVDSIIKSTQPLPPANAQDAQLDSEIRGRLSAMGHAERAAKIAEAVENDSEPVCRALFTAPAWLSGLTDVERAARLHTWRRRRHPEAVEREQRLQSALKSLDIAGTALVSFVQKLCEGPATQIAEAQARASAEAVAAAQQETAA